MNVENMHGAKVKKKKQVKSVGHYHHHKQCRSTEQAGKATSQGTKMSENRKYGASKLVFPQKKKVSVHYPQFGLAPSKMFAGLAIYTYICVCALTPFGAEHLVFSLLSKHVKLKMCRTVYRT
jgi:hypothetical protein